ncbi:Transposase, Mutator family [Pseudonocardia ammonioxydans]|uniref:Transposase, Mutator family n=1 Tax=Pseudonocardia ammonioxydans TaxID=260086 RepID=A0A1I5FVT4_PSUAM|nr:Transposase, Mutator family [Pseudonocardia ammonioxydans]
MSWTNAWERLIPFLGFPLELRKTIYTTNAIESLNYQLRKIIKFHETIGGGDPWLLRGHPLSMGTALAPDLSTIRKSDDASSPTASSSAPEPCGAGRTAYWLGHDVAAIPPPTGITAPVT